MVLKLVEKVDTHIFMSVVSLPFVGQGKTLWVSVGSDLVNLQLDEQVLLQIFVFLPPSSLANLSGLSLLVSSSLSLSQPHKRTSTLSHTYCHPLHSFLPLSLSTLARFLSFCLWLVQTRKGALDCVHACDIENAFMFQWMRTCVHVRHGV